VPTVAQILENCGRTDVFAVLLRLLLERHVGLSSLPVSPTSAAAAAASGMSPAERLEYVWGDLVVKCLIKMTKMLAATLQVRSPMTSRVYIAVVRKKPVQRQDHLPACDNVNSHRFACFER
jgi:hypothetical protein